MNAQPARPYLGIGEVLAKLRADFPDISVSKIRFLESEGLIAPARSPSGYRKFAVADVERLRYILTAQRDQYLPLRVIRERLVPATAPDASDRAQPRAAAPQATGRDNGRAAMLTRRELLDAAGVSEEQLAELEDFGLVRRRGRQYGQDALEVARTVAAMAAYGVEARHLRAVRAAAEREMSGDRTHLAPAQRRSQGQRGCRGQADRRALAAAAPRAGRDRARRGRAPRCRPAGYRTARRTRAASRHGLAGPLGGRGQRGRRGARRLPGISAAAGGGRGRARGPRLRRGQRMSFLNGPSRRPSPRDRPPHRGAGRARGDSRCTLTKGAPLSRVQN